MITEALGAHCGAAPSAARAEIMGGPDKGHDDQRKWRGVIAGNLQIAG